MAVVICHYPDQPNPLALLHRLGQYFSPNAINIEHDEVYARSIAKLEAVLLRAGMKGDDCTPLKSLKRNAALYSPQFQFTIDYSATCRISGAVNRRILDIICDDPAPVEVLRNFFEFGMGIDGATVEARDATGKHLPLDFTP